MNNKMTHQNTLLTQTQMCPKGFDDEQFYQTGDGEARRKENPEI